MHKVGDLLEAKVLGQMASGRRSEHHLFSPQYDIEMKEKQYMMHEGKGQEMDYERIRHSGGAKALFWINF